MITEDIQHQAELSARQEELTKFAKWHRCGQCESLLVVRWWRGMWEVKCGRDKEHTGYISWRDTPAQKEREAKQMVADKVGTEKGVALEPYTARAALTKVEAELVLRTIWPKAPSVEIMKAALICYQYGLNPLMKHLFLLEFRGKESSTWATVLSIKANRILARRVTAFTYIDDTPRMMTEAEQIRILGAVDTKNNWAITKVKDPAGNEAPGYGSWPKGQSVYGSEKGNSPENMAFIHSERNALDRLCPDALPPIGVVPEDYVNGEVRGLDAATGEISTGFSPPVKGEANAPGPASMQDGPQPPPVAPPAAPAQISQDRVDALSRELTAAGYLPGTAREDFFAKMKITTLAGLTPERADRLLAWLKTEAKRKAEKPDTGEVLF